MAFFSKTFLYETMKLKTFEKIEKNVLSQKIEFPQVPKEIKTGTNLFKEKLKDKLLMRKDMRNIVKLFTPKSK